MRLATCIPLLVTVACAVPCEPQGSPECLLSPCGPDEDCTPLPLPLEFTGRPFSGGLDLAPKITAVGGTQTLSVRDTDTDRPLASGFSATVDHRALVVDATARGAVVVRGVTAGKGSLQIFANGAHYVGGLGVEASPISSISFDAVTPSEEDVALLAGREHTVAVRLRDIVGRHLIDDSLAVLDGATLDTSAWDRVSLPPLPAGPHVVRLRAGGGAHDLVVDVVDRPEQVLITFPRAGSVTLSTQWSTSLCFRAVAGGKTVLGVSWEVTVDGVPVGFDVGNDCASIPPGTGLRRVVAVASGHAESFDLPSE